MYGFVDQGDTRQSIDDAFSLVYQSRIGVIEVAQYYMYVTQTLIGDAFMVSSIWYSFSLPRPL